MSLIEAALSGERLKLARLLTQVENDTPEGRAALDQLFNRTGRAHLVGITGSPGTGKSTLVNQLVRCFRRAEGSEAPPQVAVVAVDPSSPFSGGAVLGDRVRMRDLAGDTGVFIRSMAARGAAGGLARSTDAVVQVLDAAGFALILIETVGAGQSEVDIARLAHTVVVVEAPGLGDDIQAIKAGILEIADILVVNKADRPGAENTEHALRAMLQQGSPSRWAASCSNGGASGLDQQPTPGWEIPVLRTRAAEGAGVPELAQTIRKHAEYLRCSGGWKQREAVCIQRRLDGLLQAELVLRWRSTPAASHYPAALEQLEQRRFSPSQVVNALLEPDGSGLENKDKFD